MAKELRPRPWERSLGWYLAAMGGLMLASNVLTVLIAVTERAPGWFPVVSVHLGVKSFVALCLFGWGVFWLRDNRPRQLQGPETLAGDFRKFWRVPGMVTLGQG